MNLTVQKTSTKQESLMTYRGNELRSLFQPSKGQPDHLGHHEELRANQMVVPTPEGYKTNETQPKALAGDWSRRSATAPIQTSTRLGQ